MASSEGLPQPFDIVVVPFPYTDQLAEKRRPALVVSPGDFMRETGLVWVLMITSAGNRRWSGDVPVGASVETGLPAASLIRTAKIATIDAERVLRVLGRPKDGVIEEVRRVLGGMLG